MSEMLADTARRSSIREAEFIDGDQTVAYYTTDRCPVLRAQRTRAGSWCGSTSTACAPSSMWTSAARMS